MLMSDWDNSTNQSKRMFEGLGPGSQHAWGKRKAIRQGTLPLKWPEPCLPRTHFSTVNSLDAASALGMTGQNEVAPSLKAQGVATSEQVERLMKGNTRPHHPHQLGHLGPGPGKKIKANKETRRHPGDAYPLHLPGTPMHWPHSCPCRDRRL